ncbi:hypothetical protein YH63_003680 [Afipia massiliensis]|uniref:Uncharacterized protein n=1 Tax=Afipia massiliensis TaxID=211460 RepID=A0A4U6BK67_9BRAD|nr:hypothetical protein [Afipia massiliensis]TKT70582.1 hypothetical protein YH63_003680 [Afipia massiliensis]
MRVAVRSPIAALTVAAAFVLASATFSGPAFAQARQQPAPAKQAPAKEAAPAPAPEAKQMALTDKQIESVLAAQKDIDALGSEHMKPGAKAAPTNMTGKLNDVAKKHGFANYAEFAIVQNNIELVMSGFDPKTKTYIGPEAVIKQQIAEIQADKKMPAAEKKEALADLNQALKTPPPALEYKANIELVAKYYDKLAAMMQDDE